MKNRYLVLPLALALALVACSRNPDPEYAPDSDAHAAPAAVAEVDAAAAVEVAPAAPVARLSDAETLRLGQEAVALLFASDMDVLWHRFDAQVQAQAVSPENFGEMVEQIFGQIGAEMNVVEEEIVAPAAQPGLSVYRRRGHYMAIGQNVDLFVAFNADGSIAGVNFMPAE